MVHRTTGASFREVIVKKHISAPSAPKMQETRNKMPVASVYLLENLHFLPFFVADSVPGSIMMYKGDR
ncbi:MAG: hypothetical protein IJB00_08720 [Akkermansia sp.]|nr:hypothetical protein [Akkermansia sp.]